MSLVCKDGRDAVLKLYNDNGDRNVKCLREVAFYEYYSGCNSLPELIAVDCPNRIWMSRLPGLPISAWHESASPADLCRISHVHGMLLAGLLRHVPDHCRKSVASDMLARSGNPTWSVFAEGMLQNVEWHLRMNAAFDIPELRQAVDLAASIISVDGFWGEPVVCKLDWNAGNIMVDAGRISGYIDFEQSFQGNRLAFLGTVIDHINVLDWRWTRTGVIDKLESMPSMGLLKAAAAFSMCYKINGCCHDGQIGFFSPGRLLHKFGAMSAIIQGAEQGGATDVFGTGDL